MREKMTKRKEKRKRYLLVTCTSSAALNLSNRDEVAVRPRDARMHVSSRCHMSDWEWSATAP